MLITNWKIEDAPMFGGQGPYRVMIKNGDSIFFFKVPFVRRTYTDGQLWGGNGTVMGTHTLRFPIPYRGLMSVSISNGALFLKVLQDRCSGALSIAFGVGDALKARLLASLTEYVNGDRIGCGLQPSIIIKLIRALSLTWSLRALRRP